MTNELQQQTGDAEEAARLKRMEVARELGSRTLYSFAERCLYKPKNRDVNKDAEAFVLVDELHKAVLQWILPKSPNRVYAKQITLAEFATLIEEEGGRVMDDRELIYSRFHGKQFTGWRGWYVADEFIPLIPRLDQLRKDEVMARGLSAYLSGIVCKADGFVFVEDVQTALAVNLRSAGCLVERKGRRWFTEFLCDVVGHSTSLGTVYCPDRMVRKVALEGYVLRGDIALTVPDLLLVDEMRNVTFMLIEWIGKAVVKDPEGQVSSEQLFDAAKQFASSDELTEAIFGLRSKRWLVNLARNECGMPPVVRLYVRGKGTRTGWRGYRLAD